MTLQNSMHMARVFFWLIVILGSVAAGIVAFSRTKAGKVLRAQKTRHPTDSSFTCPDPLVLRACKYSEDLNAAHDLIVSRSHDATGLEYVCFRRGSDKFFTLRLSGPSVLGGIQQESQKQDPVRVAGALGWGEIAAFARGVQDMSVAPQLHFQGTWLGPHIS